MTIAVTQDYEGTLDQYDQATDRVNVRNNPPEGLIFHWVAQVDESHVRLTDVWQSQEAFDAWAQFVRPTVEELGVSLPDVRIYDVYRYQGTELAATSSDSNAARRESS